jgi:hypothetical protein
MIFVWTVIVLLLATGLAKFIKSLLRHTTAGVQISVPDSTHVAPLPLPRPIGFRIPRPEFRFPWDDPNSP